MTVSVGIIFADLMKDVWVANVRLQKRFLNQESLNFNISYFKFWIFTVQN